MLKLSDKKVVIFGGTFNPIHIGHLITGFDLIEKLKYDFVIFVPTFLPPHKDNIDLANCFDRLKMIKLAIKKIDRFIYSDIDIKRKRVTYTIDTITDIVKEFNIKEKAGFVFGDDLLSTLDSWKEIDKLNSIVDLICLKRNSQEIIYNNKFTITFFDNRIINVSSSEIRERIKKGLPVDFLLPDSVKKYIYKKSLYS